MIRTVGSALRSGRPAEPITQGGVPLPTHLAYIPLDTYPEAVADDAILASVRFAGLLDHKLHVETFAVDIPQMTSPLGGFLIDVPGLVHSAEDKSRAECRRLQDLVQGAAGSGPAANVTNREVVLGGALNTAAVQARYFDLTLLPWAAGSAAVRDMAQSVVFESGRPAILVPPSAGSARIDHIAIAWDGSRVAARALHDALQLLPAGGRATVMTVEDEKPLAQEGLAAVLVSWLAKRGIEASATEIKLGKKSIGDALQDTAIARGAQLMAMGGFGHSRLRDFILGGATTEIMNQLKVPTLLSH
jgi:nucleotide-binding universal stress UspA family protein